MNIISRQMNEISPDEERIQTNIKPGQRLRKIALELQDTERTYVKVRGLVGSLKGNIMSHRKLGGEQNHGNISEY